MHVRYHRFFSGRAPGGTGGRPPGRKQYGGGEGGPAAGVQRDKHVELGGDLVQRADQFGGPLGRVDVGGPVQGGDHVRAVPEAVSSTGGAGVELVQVRDQGVDHRV